MKETAEDRRCEQRRRADRARDKLERLGSIMLALGIVLMIVAGGLSYAGLRSIQERELASTANCRVAVGLAREVDRTNGLIWQLLVQNRSAANNRDDPAAEKRAEAYEAFAAEVRYIEPPDCKKTIGDPRHYPVPPPIPYDEYIRQGGEPPVDLPPGG